MEEQQTIEIKPQEGPQTAFLESPADIVIYGGAAGGGKTYGLLIEGTRHVDLPGFRAVYFRRTRPQIRAQGGLWDTSTGIYRYIGGKPLENTLEWKFRTGAKIKFLPMLHESDKLQHDGAQFALICFDEVQHFSESQFWYLVGRNRTTCGIRPYVRATCNPDASSWVRELIDWWIGPDGTPIPERSGIVRYFIREEGENTLKWVKKSYRSKDGDRPKSLTFIAAKLTDNPILLEANPEYASTLRALEDVERQRLLYGNWDVRPLLRGQIYPEFEARKHVLSEPHAQYLQEEMINPGLFDLFESWDFGSGASSATSVVWGWYDKTKDMLYLWDWLMGYEKPVEWYAQEVARKGYWVQCMKPWEYPGFENNTKGLRPYERTGDPAGRQRESTQRHWFSYLEDDFGIALEPSVNRPMESIQTVRHVLRRGKLMLHPRLADRIRVGPLSQGARQPKSMVDAFNEYQWKVADDFDPAKDGDNPGASHPKKTWASHPMNSVEYIVRNQWGFIPLGVVPIKGS